ncbi:hypothetical protein [Streptomyces sp. JJ36]|uniref:hypothetical protein n=1 Tax=Streptomyces sp. JJ36 TaxID=2736645 RepID=UPI001F249589|nr:hypothetical protein [Streptomyces sp. JJ36]MCF6523117.1 hypothetical protein [Streptomyces sp. JJ36]
MTMDTDKANAMVQSGRVADVLGQVLDRMQPEAVYFTPRDGRRSCVIVFDLDDPSRIPTLSEPLFQHFGAELSLQPAMSLDDLRSGLAAVQV